MSNTGIGDLTGIAVKSSVCVIWISQNGQFTHSPSLDMITLYTTLYVLKTIIIIKNYTSVRSRRYFKENYITLRYVCIKKLH